MTQSQNRIIIPVIATVSLLGIIMIGGLIYIPSCHERLKKHALSTMESSYGSSPIAPIYEAQITALAREMGIEYPIIMRKMNTTTLLQLGYHNAFAAFPQIGNLLPLVDTPFLFISEGFFEDLSEQEQRFLIGHELAHIKAEHMRYLPLIKVIVSLISFMLSWYAIRRLIFPRLAGVIHPSYHRWSLAGLLLIAVSIYPTLINLSLLYYQRQIEWEADTTSLAQLQTHEGGIKLMDRWQKEYNMASLNPYWGLCADHPSCLERRNFIIEHQKTII